MPSRPMAETNRPLANRILYGLLFGVIAGLITLGAGHYSPSSLAFMRKVATNVFDPFGHERDDGLDTIEWINAANN